MTHASLFSGIGGPEVAAEMLGWTNLFHCEINPFGRAVLAYHFPESVSYEDIKKTDFSEWRGRVDVLTGGFPCQPFSYAGKRGGAADDRYLWPEMLRAISECQPTWVVGENVSGITTMVEQESVVEVGAEATLFEDEETIPGRVYEELGRYTIDRVCAALEAIGYAVQPILIPACAVGAPHRRDRVFIIAQNTMYGGQLHGQLAVERDQRDERHVSAGDSERLCDGASGTDATNSADAGLESVRREWQDAVYGLETIADTASNRLEHSARPGSQREMSGEEQGRNTELHVSVAADGCGRTIADSDCERREEPEQSGRRAHSQEEGAGMDDRTERYGCDGSATDTAGEMLERRNDKRAERHGQGSHGSTRYDGDDVAGRGRWQRFPSVSAVHRGNDGLPFDVDDLTIPFAKWRTESLKAYGNAIVPQVMYEIFRAIELTTKKQ